MARSGIRRDSGSLADEERTHAEGSVRRIAKTASLQVKDISTHFFIGRPIHRQRGSALRLSPSKSSNKSLLDKIAEIVSLPEWLSNHSIAVICGREAKG